MKKSLVLISVGVFNFLHGIFHIIQFIQSMLLVVYSTEQHHHHHEHESGWIDTILHSPVFAIIWAIIGVVTLVIGIRDYKHHKKCHKE